MPPELDSASSWHPLSLHDVKMLFGGAPFFWCLAGGRGLAHRVGSEYRRHDDVDVVVLRPELPSVQSWLADWQLYLAGPPGTLRKWKHGEPVITPVHDIWAHRDNHSTWELQLMIQEADGDSWFFRRDRRVHGKLSDLAGMVDGIPCLRPDLQLLFKAKDVRTKDEVDFRMVLSVLSAADRAQLGSWLRLTHPRGHVWFDALAR